ncbi:MAG: low molecular weight phosphotyrosine protein phosphatase [Akkermansiaceae bacterium]|nr:low molecular weight phosphotyrosine protein phosphatase [Akkermansiaceae bacterium]
MAQKKFSVLFVCLGNICRSPAAENIFRHQVKEANLDNFIHIDSAGTHDYHPGKSPDSRMSKTLNDRAIPSNGAARQFKKSDYSKFDLIVTMDNENHAGVRSLASTNADTEKVIMFTHFCEHPDHQIAEVPDPYYGEDDGFELVANILEDGCQQLLDHLRKQLDH